MKLSIVIINWNSKKVLPECLRSICEQTRELEYEVIISDNGSTDDTLEHVRRNHPNFVIVENKVNVGFSEGNNRGIALARGEYVLILNPDTLILDRALDKWIRWADQHPEAAAFGCRVVNPDGSLQRSARPFPSLLGDWLAALCLRPLGFLSPSLCSDTYAGWNGLSEREIDWQSGCCLLVRRSVLNQMHGFDPIFFYSFDEVDLCFRIRKAGYRILYSPVPTVVHRGGQAAGLYPIPLIIEISRNRYRYFNKHYGLSGARKSRITVLTHLWIRRIGYRLSAILARSDKLKARMETYRIAIQWNAGLNVDRFLRFGEEPKLGDEAGANVLTIPGRA